ncbi:MAG: hypothetical protein EBZ77_16370, partial [Chitinophagia bacterium]|nr:hypothetical protein [Chitinophagia bacterium]
MRAWFLRFCLFVLLFAGAWIGSRAQDASRIYIEPTGWSLGTSFGVADLWGDVGTASPVDHYINGHYFE